MDFEAKSSKLPSKRDPELISHGDSNFEQYSFEQDYTPSDFENTPIDQMSDHDIAYLQRTIGNHAFGQLLRQKQQPETTPSTKNNFIQRLNNEKFSENQRFTTEVEESRFEQPYEDTNSLELAERSTEQGRGTAYIVNAIVSYRELNPLMIASVIHAMIDGLDEEDLARTAIVIGVNAKEEDYDAMNKRINSLQGIIDGFPFAISLVPLTFKAKYKKNEDGTTSLDFPYGEMRNRTMHSKETQAMTKYFLNLNLHPYISIQDFDTGSRKTGGEDGEHVFYAVDDIIAGEEDDSSSEDAEIFDEGEEFYEGNEEDDIYPELSDEGGSIAQLPLMITGGYRVGNKQKLIERTKRRLLGGYAKYLTSLGDEVTQDEIATALNEYEEEIDSNLAKVLESFSDEIDKDMQYRNEYARLDPMIPYAPEPNLFVDAGAVMAGSPKGNQLHFGAGGAEYTELAKGLSQFSADELYTHYLEEFNEIKGTLRSKTDTELKSAFLSETNVSEHTTISEKLVAFLEPSEERMMVEDEILSDSLRNELILLLEETLRRWILNKLHVDSQNNQSPVRGTNASTNFTGMNVETDLSRLAATKYENPRTAQSHKGLTTAIDRAFQTKDDKKGVNAAKTRKKFAPLLRLLDKAKALQDEKGKVEESISKLEAAKEQRPDPMRDSLSKLNQPPSTLRTGKQLSTALSVPYDEPFSGSNYGVQSDQKKQLLFQLSIEQEVRAKMDSLFGASSSRKRPPPSSDEDYSSSDEGDDFGSFSGSFGFGTAASALEKVASDAMVQNFRDNNFNLFNTAIQFTLDHWTLANGECGIYSLGHILGDDDMDRDELADRLISLGTNEANAAAAGFTGDNQNLWLSNEQVHEIGTLLGLDIAVVLFDLDTNSWVTSHGDPSTATHIVGGVPAALNGPVNHWVVLRRG